METLIYKETKEKRIELTFLPPTKKLYDRAPVYFIIPGGGWHTENRQSMIELSQISVDALREKGFAAVAPDYRVFLDGTHIEEAISDCFDAARYIAHFADKFQIDKNRFVLSGHSSGGHLALMLAYAPQNIFKKDSVLDDNFGVKAVMPMSPPTILYEDGMPITHNLRDISDVFTDESLSQKRRVSPYDYVTPKCPPTLLSAGTSDRIVFCNSSELLFEKLQENNVQSELILSVGGWHCFEKIHKNIIPVPSMQDIQNKMVEFALEHI